VRYIIYGAGAIGSGIGALLHQHGHEVVLIARGEHERQININGLTIHTPDST
jgi:2-dehydropantoate 2-reductase